MQPTNAIRLHAALLNVQDLLSLSAKDVSTGAKYAIEDDINAAVGSVLDVASKLEAASMLLKASIRTASILSAEG